MKQELGWFFPDGEGHLPEWMRSAKQKRNGIYQYQLNKYQAALAFCNARAVAIDVGAHVGQWSWNMALDFARVHAFEPVPQYAECWRRNMAEFGISGERAILHECALGNEYGTVSLRCGTPGSHGDTFIAPKDQANAAVDVGMSMLDQHGLLPDFIKIDCEGYEFFVIQGAERTIRENKPCIIVEQKPGKAQQFGLGETDAVKLLESWGAKQRAVLSGDYILSWD